MRRFALAALLLTTLPSPALMAQSAAPSPILEGKDLFALEVAGDPQISPDGTKIAYVRRSNDVMTDRLRPSIWLIDVKSGAQSPLVTGPGAHSQPRWSPDGKRLAYVSTAEGGTAQLFVRWMDTGAAVRVTGMPDSPSALAWSPDGRRIAYVMNTPEEGMKLGKAPPKPEGAQWAPPLEVIDKLVYRNDGGGYVKPGYDHIYVVPSDGGAPRQLTSGPWHDGGPLSWTPDGRTILFSAVRQGDWQREAVNTEVQALDLESGAIRALTSRNGPDSEPLVSPDGSRIAYLGYDDQGRSIDNTELYVMNRDGSGARSLTASLDRSIDKAIWAADGRSLYALYDDRGSNRVARITLDGRITPVATGLTGGQLDRPYSGGDFSVSRGGTVAFTSGDPLSPSDISVTSGGAARRLTRLNQEFFAGKRLAQVRELAVTAPDGRTVPAWLATPPNYVQGQRVPLILEIHGGPHTAYGPSFSTDVQLYAAAGYAVLYTNPRGSTSYGLDFARQIDKNYPDKDYDDLIAAVDAAIASGIADPDNLFVTGGSGGGVLTAWIVGKTDRFKAAATQKPVIDWSSFVLTADNTPFFARYWFGKMPWEDPQGYWARSPLSLVGNVKTPTLVVVGSEDYRTPVSESEQYYTALQLRGVPTALLKVPGVGHGGIASRPSQSAAKASAILAWFEKYRGRTQAGNAASAP